MTGMSPLMVTAAVRMLTWLKCKKTGAKLTQQSRESYFAEGPAIG